VVKQMSVKVVVTPWVTHDGGAIYSLDVSPTEYKLATCGNGDGGDGLIVIWSLLPMMSEEHGRNVKNHNPLLARIPMTRGVNTVRWSPCGKYFAAASDDKTVTVWEYGGRIKSAGTIGMRKEDASLEKYRCVHTLHGHSMEVLAVGWSCDGRFLASSSMDNTIVVWNALKLPERIVVLDAAREGHTGAVKGLSFDPIGKYLASQSHDKHLRVWTMDNWTCETSISEPFLDSAQSTMFMRPDWSPDGKILVAPCGMNNGGPIAQMVERGSWDTGRDLVGHRKAVTVVRSAPRCFEYEDHKGRTRKIALFAIGSRDKSLSVWGLPGLTRPLVVLYNFFKHSVMDVVWKNTTLFCCSQDGSVKTLLFDEKALGRRLRDQEMSDMCFDFYRTRPSQYTVAENGTAEDGRDGVNGNQAKGSFIETAADLIASRTTVQPPKDTQKETRDREREEAEKRAKEEAEMIEKRKEQIENRSKDGKRRIQPVFLCSTIDNSVPEKPVIPDDVLELEKADAPPPAKRMKKQDKPVCGSIAKEIDTRDTGDTSSSTGSSSESSSASNSSDEDCDMEGLADDEGEPAVVDDRSNFTNREHMLVADFRRPQMRSLERVQKDSLTLAAAEMQRMLLQPIGGVKQAFIASYNEWASPTGVRATQVVRLKWLDDGSLPELEEGVPPGEKLVWTTFLNAPVLVMTANAKWTVLVCSDCSLHVLVTETGAFSFMLQLDSLPAQLGMQDSRTFVLTSNGYFSCWDLAKSTAILSRIPVLDIVSNDVHLHSISLSPSGSPLISFTNGSTYSYSVNLQSWIPVDTCNGLSRISGEALSNDDLGGGAIATAIRNKKRPGVAPKTSLATRTWVGQAQMEGWIFAALDARSHEDLRPMVVRYTDMLIMNNTTGKVRDLLSTLDSWVERARRKEKCDEWMDEERMKEMREMVRQLISADASMCEVLKDLENEGSLVF
ncbi:hypothetical protein PENTCL1PPCAC_13747, partial [Pristionchus entomophagus]